MHAHPLTIAEQRAVDTLLSALDALGPEPQMPLGGAPEAVLDEAYYRVLNWRLRNESLRGVLADYLLRDAIAKRLAIVVHLVREGVDEAMCCAVLVSESPGGMFTTDPQMATCLGAAQFLIDDEAEGPAARGAYRHGHPNPLTASRAGFAAHLRLVHRMPGAADPVTDHHHDHVSYYDYFAGELGRPVTFTEAEARAAWESADRVAAGQGAENMAGREPELRATVEDMTLRDGHDFPSVRIGAFCRSQTEVDAWQAAVGQEFRLVPVVPE